MAGPRSNGSSGLRELLPQEQMLPRLGSCALQSLQGMACQLLGEVHPLHRGCEALELRRMGLGVGEDPQASWAWG